MTFARGLSDGFLAQLREGPAAALLAAWREADLDVRLRYDAISAYDVGPRVGHLVPSRRGLVLEVHAKYLGEDAERYRRVPVDASLVARLPEMRRLAAAWAGHEERVEDAFVRANREPPFAVLDRQVQVPGVERRMDVVGVSDGAFVVVEIKRDLDNRIQDVPVQLAAYLAILDPVGQGLRADVAESYRRVCAQMRSLGLRAPPADAVCAGMPVHGLIALARYNPRSALLERARATARTVRGPQWLVHLDEAARLPAREAWEVLPTA